MSLFVFSNKDRNKEFLFVQFKVYDVPPVVTSNGSMYTNILRPSVDQTCYLVFVVEPKIEKNTHFGFA